MLAGRALHTTRSCPRRARPLSGKGGEGSLKVGWQHRTVASGPCCSFWRRRGALKVGALALVRLPLCGCVGGEAYLRVRPARLFKEFSPFANLASGLAGVVPAAAGRVLALRSRQAAARRRVRSAVLVLVRPGGVGVCVLLEVVCCCLVATRVCLGVRRQWRCACVWLGTRRGSGCARSLPHEKVCKGGKVGVVFLFQRYGSIACVSLCPSPDSSGMPAAL